MNSRRLNQRKSGKWFPDAGSKEQDPAYDNVGRVLI